MDKRIVNGCVGVVITVSYGSDLHYPQYPHLRFDPKLIDLIVVGLQGDAIQHIQENYPDVYNAMRMKLHVQFIPQGKRFRIEEYDGAEHIITEDDLNLTA